MVWHAKLIQLSLLQSLTFSTVDLIIIKSTVESLSRWQNINIKIFFKKYTWELRCHLVELAPTDSEQSSSAELKKKKYTYICHVYMYLKIATYIKLLTTFWHSRAPSESSFPSISYLDLIYEGNDLKPTLHNKMDVRGKIRKLKMKSKTL